MEYEEFRKSCVSGSRSLDQSQGNKENANLQSFEMTQKRWVRQRHRGPKDGQVDLSVTARPALSPCDVNSSHNSHSSAFKPISQNSQRKIGERTLAKSGSSVSYYNPFEVASEGKSYVPSDKSRLVDTSGHQVF